MTGRRRIVCHLKGVTSFMIFKTIPVGVLFIGALVAVIVSITLVPHRGSATVLRMPSVLTPV